MDQTIYNGIASNIRGIEDTFGVRSHFILGDRTHSTDPRRQ